MNRADVLKMMQDAGAGREDVKPLNYNGIVDVFERVVEMAITADREQHNRETGAAWRLMCEKMVAAKQEQCAKACEALEQPDGEDNFEAGVMYAIHAIRALGPQ